MEGTTMDTSEKGIDESLRHGAVSPQQVAPWPEVELQHNLDHRQLVRDLIAQHSDATADEIERMLEERGIKISSTLVLQELQRR